jgi:hypothetical protein
VSELVRPETTDEQQRGSHAGCRRGCLAAFDVTVANQTRMYDYLLGGCFL